jgi:hypothetical protein
MSDRYTIHSTAPDRPMSARELNTWPNPCCVREATSTFDLTAQVYARLLVQPTRTPKAEKALKTLHKLLIELAAKP